MNREGKVTAFNHEYITQRLLWEQLSKLVTRADISRMISKLARSLQRTKKVLPTTKIVDMEGCVSCGMVDIPTMFVGDMCNHLHCYSCIQETKVCGVCGTRIGSIERVVPDHHQQAAAAVVLHDG